MIRYMVWFCAAMAGGCLGGDINKEAAALIGDDLSRDAHIVHEASFQSCGAAYDCKLDNQCAIPQCVESACVYVPEVNGLSCIDSAGAKGVCVDLSCVPIGEAMIAQCSGPSDACVYDSDCFVRECTSSVCVNGSCQHVAYKDGATCIDYNESNGFYVGACIDCVCVK